MLHPQRELSNTWSSVSVGGQSPHPAHRYHPLHQGHARHGSDFETSEVTVLSSPAAVLPAQHASGYSATASPAVVAVAALRRASQEDQPDNTGIPFLPGVRVRHTASSRVLGCSQCASEFTSIHDLCVHLRKAHFVLQPFQCQELGCRRFVTTKAVLDAHMLTHTGEKPFPCTFLGCGASFTQKSNMIRHARTHGNEKPVRATAEHVVPEFSRAFKIIYIVYGLFDKLGGWPPLRFTSSAPAPHQRTDTVTVVGVSPPRMFLMRGTHS